MMKINVSTVEIDVVRKRIKNMHLSVLPPSGKVRVSAPIGTSDEAIRLFAISKIGWIKKQIKRFQDQPRQSEREYVTGESHYLWGRRYKLQVEYTKGAGRVKLNGNKLFLLVKESSSKEQREKIIIEWYRSRLKEKLPPLIAKWEERMNVKINETGVKNMRTKWGTCNVKDKRIWVNLQLAKKPPACLEYIVVHEMVHLLEKNHSKIFIKHMDKFLPDWRLTKDQLNDFIMDEYIEEST